MQKLQSCLWGVNELNAMMKMIKIVWVVVTSVAANIFIQSLNLCYIHFITEVCIINVLADGLAPNGARPSAVTVQAASGIHNITFCQGISDFPILIWFLKHYSGITWYRSIQSVWVVITSAATSILTLSLNVCPVADYFSPVCFAIVD